MIDHFVGLALKVLMIERALMLLVLVVFILFLFVCFFVFCFFVSLVDHFITIRHPLENVLRSY